MGQASGAQTLVWIDGPQGAWASPENRMLPRRQSIGPGQWQTYARGLTWGRGQVR